MHSLAYDKKRGYKRSMFFSAHNRRRGDLTSREPSYQTSAGSTLPPSLRDVTTELPA